MVTASELLENKLLVLFQFRTTIGFIYFLPHSDYASKSEEESAKISIINADWNEALMRVAAQSDIDIKCRLTFDTKREMVEAFEVESVTRVEKEY